jgi:hypothetical protein
MQMIWYFWCIKVHESKPKKMHLIRCVALKFRLQVFY